MAEPIYLIETTLEKEDYRRFLYTATFFKEKLTFPLIALMSLGGSVLISLGEPWRSVPTVLLLWAALFVLSVAGICLMVETKNRQRVKTDRSALFGSKVILKFYEDSLSVEQPAFSSSSTLGYDQFYALLESREYYIFYFNANQATLIRKKDIAKEAEFRDFLKGKFWGRYKTTGFSKKP